MTHHLSPRQQGANQAQANAQLNGFGQLVQQAQHEQQSPSSSSQGATSTLQHALPAGHHGPSQHQLLNALQAHHQQQQQQQQQNGLHLSPSLPSMGPQRPRVDSFYSHATNGYSEHKV